MEPRLWEDGTAACKQDYVDVKSEDEDDDSVLIENTPTNLEASLSDAQSFHPAGQNVQGNLEHHLMNQPAFGGNGLSLLNVPPVSQMSHPASMHSDNRGPEVEFGFLHKRRRTSLQGESSMETREPEYEESGTVVYEYEPDYDCGSVVSEASYTGDQQRTLAEVLNYCQAMYDTIQKLDKKFDALQRKVSEMQHVRMKPLLFKPRPVGLSHRSSFNMPPGKMKLKLQKPFHSEANMQVFSAPPGRSNPAVRVRVENNLGLTSSPLNPSHSGTLLQDPQQTILRQSPPLPTIVSTHSLQAPFSMAECIPNQNAQANLCNAVAESSGRVSPMSVSTPAMSLRSSDTLKATPEGSFRDKGPVLMNYIPPSESVTISEEQPSSSESSNPCLDFIGDPKREVKVFGNYLMKARQKTKPKYAARYLVRTLFPKETLLCSTMGIGTRGRRSLDPNKVSAIREFIAATFPNYELTEYGRDWKTCITSVNAMIRGIRCETKRDMQSISQRNDTAVEEPQPSICVDSDNNEDEDDSMSHSSQNGTGMTEAGPPHPSSDNTVKEELPPQPSNKAQSVEPMDFLGKSYRNVQLPFSVIYVAKGKPRPELSARFLIRALFTEDVLVKSNVYGNKERGVAPLDCNKINALRDFLQENYPSFHLNESGFDWKACVAAINSTIRSLRHDHKKASSGTRKTNVQAQTPCEIGSSQNHPPAGPYTSDTITLID